MREALAAADFETFYARIKFTPEGDGDPLTLGGMIGQVQKGKLETVFPEAAKSAAAGLSGADLGQEGLTDSHRWGRATPVASRALHDASLE